MHWSASPDPERKVGRSPRRRQPPTRLWKGFTAGGHRALTAEVRSPQLVRGHLVPSDGHRPPLPRPAGSPASPWPLTPAGRHPGLRASHAVPHVS